MPLDDGPIEVLPAERRVVGEPHPIPGELEIDWGSFDVIDDNQVRPADPSSIESP